MIRLRSRKRDSKGYRWWAFFAVLLVALFLCINPATADAAGETGGAEQGTSAGTGTGTSTGTGTGTGTGSSGGAATTSQGMQISIDLRLTEKSAIVVAKAKNGTPAMYYILMKEDGEKAPTAEETRKNGTKTRDGYLSMPPVTENVEYIFYAVAEDSSGKLGQVFSKRGASSASRGIGINGHIYCTLQVRDEIDDCMNTPGEISINVGAGKAAKKIEYIIADKFVNSEGMIETIANEKQDVNTSAGTSSLNISKWSVYDPNRKPGLVKNMLNYVYVKITNPDDTVDYYSSRGIWEDETLPIAGSVTAEADETRAVVTVTGNDDESGVRKYYMLLRDPIDLTTVKPEDVVKKGRVSDDGIFNLTGLSKRTRYDLYAVVEDMAGNLSQVKSGDLTTTGEPSASSVRQSSDTSGNPGSTSNVAKRTEGVSLQDPELIRLVEDRIPYLVTAEGKASTEFLSITGWDKISVIIGNASDQSDIYIDMNGGTVIPADVLEKAAGRNINCHFIMDDLFTWVVNGRRIQSVDQSADIRVTPVSGRIPSQLVNDLAGVYPREEFSVAGGGATRFPGVLNVKLGLENEGKNAYLYSYTGQDTGLTLLQTTTVDNNGLAAFTLTEASEYVVIVGPTEKVAPSDRQDEPERRSGNGADFANESKNSENLWIILVSVFAVLLFGFILFLPKEKYEEEGPEEEQDEQQE